MSKFLNREAAYDYNTLECWYQDSLLNPNSPPVWTNEHLMELLNDFYLIPKDTPVVDVAEVKHGYWKDTEYGFCSVCDRSISEIYDADSSMAYGILDELTVCPFCGAKMDGKEKDNAE